MKPVRTVHVDGTMGRYPRYFCILPWIHIHGTVDGIWGRCCCDLKTHHGYYDRYADEGQARFTLDDHCLGTIGTSLFARDNKGKVFDLLQAFNCPEMRRTRRSIINGEAVDACEYCYWKEKNGLSSHRQNVNKLFASAYQYGDMMRCTRPDGTFEATPRYLDIRFGNCCNLECIMCFFPSSNKLGTRGNVKWKHAVIDPYKDNTQLWDMLGKLSGSLDRVYFAGGEPFLQEGHYRFIDLMIQRGVSSRIDLEYNTNLTVLSEHAVDALRSFRSVRIGASCDGVGATYERIRKGAVWDVFVSNIRRIKNHADIILLVTVQKDNVLELDTIMDFAMDENIQVDLSTVLKWPAQLSILSLPRNEMGRIVDKYTSYRDGIPETRGAVRHQLQELLGFLKSRMLDGEVPEGV